MLVVIVTLRNLTEFNWNAGECYGTSLKGTSWGVELFSSLQPLLLFSEHLYVICPYLLAVLSSEYFVDWIKHAFITKFNSIPVEVCHVHSFFQFFCQQSGI